MNTLLCAGLLFRLDGVKELLTSSHSSMDITAKRLPRHKGQETPAVTEMCDAQSAFCKLLVQVTETRSSYMLGKSSTIERPPVSNQAS